MTICYSGRSRPTAMKIAEALRDRGVEVDLNRGYRGDVNWGRNEADTALNPNISNVTNKRVMRGLFRDNKVPMPELVSVDDIRSTTFDGGGIVYVGRPDRHSKGRGFWLITDENSLQKALRGTRKKKPATHFMAFVDAPKEYRVHIFKGKSIRISEKDFTDDKRDYVTVKPSSRVYHVRKAAKKAMKAVGLDFGAVDILANETECWVLEVNAAPGLGGSMPALYAKVFEEYMRGV